MILSGREMLLWLIVIFVLFFLLGSAMVGDFLKGIGSGASIVAAFLGCSLVATFKRQSLQKIKGRIDWLAMKTCALISLGFISYFFLT